MNFVFVSPQFPETYWNFCAALRRNGVNVLGVGDTPYDDLSCQLRDVLTEYYRVDSLEDYDKVFRAVAYFSYKYGKVDWVESNNEYWLSLDARLRDDFHVTTGAGVDKMAEWQSKAGMKPLYAAAGVPSARQSKVTSIDAALDFAREVGYPVFAKPEYGMGAGGTAKVDNAEQLQALFCSIPADEPYVLEEFVPSSGITAYDAILDSHGYPLFENQEEFPPSMAVIAHEQLDLAYWSHPDVDPRLRDLGRATAKSFGLASRFVHMEFFRLAEDKPGLGGRGDYVGLEVNCRPAGGYTPDMMNFAHSTDVYQIWANMVTSDCRGLPESNDLYWCVYAGRRDVHQYVHSHQEILDAWGDLIVMQRRIPDALSDDMGNQTYTARVRTEDELRDFVSFVQEQR